MTDYTQGNPQIVQRMKDEARLFYGLAGRGATAPGCVVIRDLPHNTLHPFVVHFGNTQDGGYYFGDYCETLEDAMDALYRKLRNYDPDNARREAFKN